MTLEQFANDAASELAVPCLIGDDAITVVSAGTFPTVGPFRIRVDVELMLVTSVSGSLFNVTRGIEGTSAAAHAQGATVTHIITAGGLIAAIEDAVNTVNAVQYVNPSAAPAATSLTTAAPEITAIGSGKFLISAAACPYATGAPTVISFALFRDSTQLPPRHMNTDTGPGNHSPDVITWIDTPGDELPHVYSLVATPQAGDIADAANHQWIIVYEL